MPRRPLQFIFDFDGTLTKKDTLHLVADTGYRRHDLGGGRGQLPPWQDIVDAYMSDYSAHANNYNPSKEKRTSLSSEAAWLNSLEDVEKASAERVIDAGIFDDVTKQNMEEAADMALKNGDVELRPGWTELLITIRNLNARASLNVSKPDGVQLVSVNWSRWFVWNVVWKAALNIDDQGKSSQLQDILLGAAVYANEVPSITSDSNSLLASAPEPKGQAMTLRTAGDKLKHLQSKAVNPDTRTDMRTVYVGDSTTDLECLVVADIGICMQDHSMSSGQKDLALTCERLGISVKSLDEYEERPKALQTLEEVEKSMIYGPVTLYYARDFNEIARWVAS